jgi:hypothetical protein
LRSHHSLQIRETKGDDISLPLDPRKGTQGERKAKQAISPDSKKVEKRWDTPLLKKPLSTKKKTLTEGGSQASTIGSKKRMTISCFY